MYFYSVLFLLMQIFLDNQTHIHDVYQSYNNSVINSISEEFASSYHGAKVLEFIVFFGKLGPLHKKKIRNAPDHSAGERYLLHICYTINPDDSGSSDFGKEAYHTT